MAVGEFGGSGVRQKIKVLECVGKRRGERIACRLVQKPQLVGQRPGYDFLSI